MANYTMRFWIKKNITHLLVWSLLVLYLFTAKGFYLNYFLKNGKPVANIDVRPVEVSRGMYSIDGLDQVRYDGQDLYRIRGWAFHPDKNTFDLVDNQKRIILASDNRWYAFDMRTIPRNDLNKAMREMIENFDLDVTYSGFEGHISDNILSVGSYQIGIEFITKNTASINYFFWTDKYLYRTPNKLLLTNSPIHENRFEVLLQKIMNRLNSVGEN